MPEIDLTILAEAGQRKLEEDASNGAMIGLSEEENREETK